MSANWIRPILPSASGPRFPAFGLDLLALLFEGILTAIVRLQTGHQEAQELESFHMRMKPALREIVFTQRAEVNPQTALSAQHASQPARTKFLAATDRPPKASSSKDL